MRAAEPKASRARRSAATAEALSWCQSRANANRRFPLCGRTIGSPSVSDTPSAASSRGTRLEPSVRLFAPAGGRRRKQRESREPRNARLDGDPSSRYTHLANRAWRVPRRPDIRLHVRGGQDSPTDSEGIVTALLRLLLICDLQERGRWQRTVDRKGSTNSATYGADRADA